MEPTTVFKLQDVVPLDRLREIMLDLSMAVELKVSLASYKGTCYEGLESSGSCAECKQSGMEQCCEKIISYAGLEAARQEKPILFRCYIGGAMVAAPIQVNGQYLGILLLGPTRLPENELIQLEQITMPQDNVTILPPDLRNQKRVQFSCTLERLRALSRQAYGTAKYIAEICCSSIRQMQLEEAQRKWQQELANSAELKKKLSATQLKTMQAQMNPHFLFNALNTISQQSLLEGAEKTSVLIVSLADILRKTIKASDKLCSLGDEVAYIKSYLQIVRVSLQHRLRIVCDVDDSCLDSQIPILTIQPLVENAIIHGIEGKEEGGTVTVSIQRAGGRVQITVSDTGQGMAPETLTRIRAMQNPIAATIQGTALGVRNVIQILSETYHEEFRWSVESEPGQGTSFILRTPYRPLITDDEQEDFSVS